MSSTFDIRSASAATTDPTGPVVASFDTYAAAQLAVDSLADREFPVEHVRIVGDGVRILEQVSGRMTKGRAAGLGAASGAWAGLFIGLLLGLFAVVGWSTIVLSSVVLGALFGLVAGWVGHAMTGGTRDFTSVQGLVADRYDVHADPEYAEQARALLAR